MSHNFELIDTIENLSLLKCKNKFVFEITKDDVILGVFEVTQGVLSCYHAIQAFKGDEPKKIINLLKNLRQKYDFRIDRSFFESLNYIPVESIFVDHLLANFNNCEFITHNSQTYLNINTNLALNNIHLLFEKEISICNRSAVYHKIWSNIHKLQSKKLYDVIKLIFKIYKFNFSSHEIFKIITECEGVDLLFLEILLEYQPNVLLFLNQRQRNTIVNKQDKNLDFNLIKLLLRYKIKDTQMRLFQLICVKGDQESLDMYYTYLKETDYNKMISIENFNSMCNTIRFNEKIENIESEILRFKDMEQLIFKNNKFWEYA